MKNTEKKKTFGNYIIGSWCCKICNYEIFPNLLNKTQDNFKWGLGISTTGYVTPFCPKCNILLEYNEDA